jgi:hypothetical protein
LLTVLRQRRDALLLAPPEFLRAVSSPQALVAQPVLAVLLLAPLVVRLASQRLVERVAVSQV